MKRLTYLAATLLLLLWCQTASADNARWDIAGHHAITWNKLRGGVPHSDHVEMAGKKVAVVYYWGVDKNGAWQMNRHLVFPMLRTVPDNTHASWMPRCDVDFLKGLTIDKRAVTGESIEQVRLDGLLTSISTLKSRDVEMQLTRRYFPSTTHQAVCELYTISNTSDKAHTLCIASLYQVQTTNSSDGTRGSYRLVASTAHKENLKVTLQAGEAVTFYCSVQAYAVKDEEETAINVEEEYTQRQAFVAHVTSNLDFHCPNDTLNTLFAFSKIRGAESIFQTEGGPMHAPGGESYYAAIWCNDQAEYINPFFPFLGYDYGNASALNSYLHFARYMNDEMRPIPSSIISEGRGYWNGAGDRGDAAMLAYGASRYALARGSKAEAEQLWPLIAWSLSYCHGQLTQDGVVASDCDELERRLPAGKANLCTSTLYYDALLSAAWLAKELGKPASTAADYRQQAATLRKHIDKHFHAEVEGYDTYRYYEGNDKLRSWICIPLTMGIYDRAQGTIKAMTSPSLWTENGMLSVSGDKIFWDRSTLYGLRGAFAAGYPDVALDYMQKYSAIRLLGEHVPYAVEAWPEGGQRHLSAESGLYCRVVTEGLLGFRPTGFRSFTLMPQMPEGWESYTLRNIHACTDEPLDITVTRRGSKLQVVITKKGKRVHKFLVKPGTALEVH